MSKSFGRAALVAAFVLSLIVALVVAGPPASAHASRPVITGLSSHRGPATGGGVLAISGRRLGSTRRVYFGPRRGVILRHVGTHRLIVRVPARSSGYDTGSVWVHVSGPHGRSAGSSRSRYTFVQPRPVITSLSRVTGDTVNPYAVVIHGRYLGGEDDVTFGTDRVIGRLFNDDTAIKLYPGAHAEGTVNVRVHTLSGWSATGTQTEYTFVPAPVVRSLAPTDGPLAGGGLVTISATRAPAVTGVRVGYLPAPIVARDDAHVTVEMPARTAGTVDIRLITPLGMSSIVDADRYRFGPANTETMSDGLTVDPTRTIRTAACPDPSFCMLVLDNGQWMARSGSTWGAQSADSAGYIPSCPASNFCMSVLAGFVWTWDGTRWTRTEGPEGADLHRVVCTSSAFCLAQDAHSVRTWTATSGWQPPMHVGSGYIDAISCWADGECAVADTHTLFFLRDGAWSDGAGTEIVPPGSSLSALKCLDYDHCLAGTSGGAIVVGTRYGAAPTTRDVLPERVEQLACTSPTSCIARGATHTATFDGTYWTASVPTPQPSTAVSCWADRQCVVTTAHDAYDVSW